MVILRAAVYAVIFVGVVIVLAPSRLLAWSGIVPPKAIGPVELLGLLIGISGAIVALWCVGTFATVGRGTPAPFDPPRNLVVRGPYAYVRNPMYLGAGVLLLGAAIYYRSWALLTYTALLLVVVRAFVLGYEEPTLRRLFGQVYEDYKRRVPRWLPNLRATAERAQHE